MTAWERFYYGALALTMIGAMSAWKARAHLLLGAVLVALVMSGCARIEGDGFRNGGTGYRGVKLCKQKTSTGERWFRC